MNLALVKRVRTHLSDSAAVKPALVKRVLLTLCGIAVAGIGYRAQVAATQTPVVPAAMHGERRDDTRAPPASVHLQFSTSTVPATSPGAAPATASASHARAGTAEATLAGTPRAT